MRVPRSLVAWSLAVLVVIGCGGGTPTVAPSAEPVTPPSALPSSSPPASAAPTELVLGQTFGLVYDPMVERVLLVNGAIERGRSRSTEVWTWTGEAWELLDAAGPEARSFAAIGRDPARGVVVVHGGLDADGTAFDETLEWNGREWTVHEGNGRGPGAREGAGMAHDTTHDRMVLFGGALGPEQRADTWAWDGRSWERVADTGPRPRFVSLLAEDRATGDILLQGGHWVDGDDGGFLADTWLWDGAAWREAVGPAADGTGLGPRVNAPGAWDGNREGIVLVGGGSGADAPFAADTWLWRDGAWSEVPVSDGPSPRNGHAIAFDERRRVLVLVGGIDRPGGSQTLDVWELDAAGWREVLAPG
ncbi:MAG TPA: kelch repeat-containing protein [Clostridia bacterium]|nr:kelch repeat-containing protein [Clostridia bacterium]